MTSLTLFLCFFALRSSEQRTLEKYLLTGDGRVIIKTLRHLDTSRTDYRRTFYTDCWCLPRKSFRGQNWLELARYLKAEGQWWRFRLLLALTGEARRQYFPGVPPGSIHRLSSW